MPSTLHEVPSEFAASVVFLETRVAQEAGTHLFLLDTGAPVSAIDQQLVRDLGLAEVLSRSSVRGELPSLDDTELRFGSVSFVAPKLNVIDLEQLSNAAGLQVGGILGLDVFMSHAIRIDFAERRVEIVEAAEFAYKGSGFMLPVALGHYAYSLATIGSQFGEEHGVSVMLDTGCNGALVIPEGLARELRLETSPGGLSRSIDSESMGYVAELEIFNIGRFTFGPCDAIVKMSGAGLDNDVQIGAELFARFVAIFDLSRGRVILEPGPRFGEPIRKQRLGFGIATAGAPYDRFIVRGVIPGLPGHKAGLREGDELHAIDHQQAAVELGVEGILRLLTRADLRGSPIELLVRRGSSELRITVRPNRTSTEVHE